MSEKSAKFLSFFLIFSISMRNWLFATTGSRVKSAIKDYQAYVLMPLYINSFPQAQNLAWSRLLFQVMLFNKQSFSLGIWASAFSWVYTGIFWCEPYRLKTVP